MSLLKASKLNSRGISHILLPLLIIMAVAIAGTFMLVSKHAKSSQVVLGTNTSAVNSIDSPSNQAVAKASSNACAQEQANEHYGAKWKVIKGACRVVCNSKETHVNKDGAYTQYCYCKDGYQRATGNAGERRCVKVNPCAQQQANEHYGAKWKVIRGECRVVCNSKETHVNKSGEYSHYCYCKDGYQRVSSRAGERGCKKVPPCQQQNAAEKYGAKWKVIRGECRVDCNSKETHVNKEGVYGKYCHCKEGYVRASGKAGERRCNKVVWKYDTYKRMSGSTLGKIKKAAAADNGGVCHDGRDIQITYLNKSSWYEQFGDIADRNFDEVSVENGDPGFKASDGSSARAYNSDTLANVAFIGAGDPNNPQNVGGKKSRYYCRVYIYEDRLKDNWTNHGWEDNHWKLSSYMCILMSHEVGHLDGKRHVNDPKNIMFPAAQSIMHYFYQGYSGSHCYRNEAFGTPFFKYPYKSE